MESSASFFRWSKLIRLPSVLGLTLMCPRILGFLNVPTDAWPVAELASEILTVRNNQALGSAGETRIGGL